jgi:AraC-like DNA-binding protein/mannose-6-phosphate isomerase-like protein (cupin superfamily)
MLGKFKSVFRNRLLDDIIHGMSSPHADPKVECVLRGSRFQMPIVQSLVSLKSRSASRITWHSHEVYELLYLLDGATEYEFVDGGTVVLPGGHFLIIPPGVRHRGLHNVRRPARLCSILLHCSEPKGNSNTVFTRTEFRWIFERVAEATKLAWPMGAELRKLAIQLGFQIRAFDSKVPESAAALRLTVCGVLLETTRQLTVTRTMPPDEAVRTAIAYMESRFDQSFSIYDLAKEIGCSRARLFEIFKQATGLTPNDYLQRIRVNKAATMLHDTDLPITEIALICGFNTSQYFSSVFRKYHNRTPSELRLIAIADGSR